MTVRDIISLAQSGELLQLSPTIKDNDNTVVAFINLGLIEIYKRFVLRTDEAILTLKDGKTIYKLDGTDNTTVIINGVTLPCVLMGASRYMYMIAAYGPALTESDYTATDVVLPINEEDNLMSINTISYNEVQVPLITEGSQVSIIYASLPTRVSTSVVGWDSLELDIPEQFTETLLHYIGYRGHGAMDGKIDTESNTHYMRFEASCNKLRELGVGITPDDISMDTRVYDRGFI